MNVLGPASVWILLGFCACSLDERELTLAADAGGRGGSAGQGGTGAGRPPSGDGAAGGAGGDSDDGLVDGCADLDTDGVADCTTTMVKTPTFAEDVAGWVAVEGAQLTWDTKNALSDRPSGSAKLSASTFRASARQCVELAGRQLVIAYAQVLTESDPVAAQGQLHVGFFESEDCSGDESGFFETPPSTKADEWTTVQAGGISGVSTASLAISLVGVKPSSAEQLGVYFDNVMLKAQDPD